MACPERELAQHSLILRVRKAGEHSRKDGQSLLRLQLVRMNEKGTERGALDGLGYEPYGVLALDVVNNADDVRVRELLKDSGFLAEAFS